MENKPAWKRISASVYPYTVCANFKVEITKLLNAGELQRELDTQLADHIRKCHTEEDSQPGRQMDEAKKQPPNRAYNSRIIEGEKAMVLPCLDNSASRIHPIPN